MLKQNFKNINSIHLLAVSYGYVTWCLLRIINLDKENKLLGFLNCWDFFFFCGKVRSEELNDMYP